MASDPQHHVRLATAADLAALVPLFQAYMRETYAQPWHGSAEALAADALGQRYSLLVAADPQQSLIGFLAWMPSYDLHHCVSGGEVLDLYVQPPSHGRGLALLLGCAAAAQVLEAGGQYLKGSVVPTGSGSRLYRRLAVCDAAGCIVIKLSGVFISSLWYLHFGRASLSMPLEHTYSHAVQLVHFRFDQTEDRGTVDVDAAIAAFRSFPFREQQEHAGSLPRADVPDGDIS